ncbi:cytochrome b/b6 domain-containing protein [Archaeoglobus veneficus]|uniref:Cytochrome b subunit of formate dehydrogenase-like protein n=1 Tax=Archaeoglobus veneficus (strain DSM 11195 / SNP6) TaxID=693661 RepID=F2KN79_ARCVS|nr:cytochrome b/b6 domain-containing protein [Archaeoglobus veneficus]AEA46180.1 cytochrome b subunit of formate dehydrogenase-like protein [Archaeoglobus veneficus SNP6]
MAETVEVYRHSLFYRMCHWAIVITGFILAFTGMQMAGLYGVRILGGGQSLAVHITVSFVFGALWFLMLYYIIAEEWKWFGFGRIPYSIKFLIAEAKAWLGIGPHIEDPRGYNPDKNEYVEKIIPTEVMVWWIYFVLAMLMGITGLAMYYREFFQPVIDFAASIAPLFGAYDGYALLRAIHRFGMYLFAMVMFMHVYAVLIFGVLPSMISGRRKEKVVRE